jgi:hypothetical protein
MLWLGLLPTAALPNHFNYQYYVYTPMVGAAIAGGGAVAVARQLARRNTRPAAAIAVWATAWSLVAFMHAETRALPELQWPRFIAVESRRSWVGFPKPYRRCRRARASY